MLSLINKLLSSLVLTSQDSSKSQGQCSFFNPWSCIKSDWLSNWWWCKSRYQVAVICSTQDECDLALISCLKLLKCCDVLPTSSLAPGTQPLTPLHSLHSGEDVLASYIRSFYPTAPLWVSTLPHAANQKHVFTCLHFNLMLLSSVVTLSGLCSWCPLPVSWRHLSLRYSASPSALRASCRANPFHLAVSTFTYIYDLVCFYTKFDVFMN